MGPSVIVLVGDERSILFENYTFLTGFVGPGLFFFLSLFNLGVLRWAVFEKHFTTSDRTKALGKVPAANWHGYDHMPLCIFLLECGGDSMYHEMLEGESVT